MTFTPESPVAPEALVALAAEAGVRAGRHVIERRRDGVTLRTKGAAHDMVTEIDAEAEAVIRAMLTVGTVVGEESGVSGSGDVRWYVDPIDGTYNFARGVALFAVSIGVEVGGRLVGGVVYDPVRDELFTAVGGELRLNGRLLGTDPPAPLSTPASASAAPDSPPMVLTDIPTAGLRDTAEFELFADLLETTDLRRIGSSALALAWVACGRADLTANADVFVWDVAAGRALVAAAGGGFVGVPGEPGTERRTGFVAWRPGFAGLGGRVAAGLATFAHLCPELANRLAGRGTPTI
ncbi:inositol monophosphatase family protein [Streptosporangium sp. NPDC006007]|uniref:inositol monophosphatase family protein n=1 Tax=Streptosporangium sp. NPDC006007 TaxID=3154575 RepID=UPI0033B310D3